MSSFGVVEDGGISDASLLPATGAADPSSFFLFFRSEPPIVVNMCFSSLSRSRMKGTAKWKIYCSYKGTEVTTKVPTTRFVCCYRRLQVSLVSRRRTEVGSFSEWLAPLIDHRTHIRRLRVSLVYGYLAYAQKVTENILLYIMDE